MVILSFIDTSFPVKIGSIDSLNLSFVSNFSLLKFAFKSYPSISMNLSSEVILLK